ncbi:MAG: BMP family ABC transporter substrate-binding protein [Oscillibacter sp.]|nr:BMP family ABC transporter substrate-binding protein [Oscillibacter sp.]MBQ7681605.1 BMP family ABC transporter substrate-binding protein [Oscillibacter sp.]MBQ9617330.1 BMP family ABC transporter substrate-binding protein [Oscillibacter sp.]
MKKKVLSLLLAAGMVLAMLTGCGGGDASGTPSGSGGGDGTYKVALLIAGTLGDKSFWDSANDGLASLKAELGDEFEYKVEQMGGGAADQANYEPTILDYCDSGEYDVIVTGSFTMVDALSSAVEQFPDQKFILFDEAYDFEAHGNPDNVYNILFKQNEVSYLVGAEAAMLSQSGAICFLGGMAGKVINDFLVGYIQGARDAKSDIKVAVSMVGNYEDSAKGKDLSLAMFNAGADCGFNVAGSAGMGLLEAAKETGKLAFGVDSDQAALLPDYAPYIPTSALKNVGNALYIALKQDLAGTLAYGTQAYFGFAEGGVNLVKDAHYEEMVPEDIRAAVDELEAQISSGEIQVYTSATMSTEEIESLKASVALQ